MAKIPCVLYPDPVDGCRRTPSNSVKQGPPDDRDVNSDDHGRRCPGCQR
jgi:hypothetical protein